MDSKGTNNVPYKGASSLFREGICDFEYTYYYVNRLDGIEKMLGFVCFK